MKPMLPKNVSGLHFVRSASVGLTLDVWKQTLVLWVVADETLESTSNHGVLAHQDGRLPTESCSDFVHLLRRDIVDTDLPNLLATWTSPMLGAKLAMKIDLYSSSNALSLSK
jgi:hypothetical protein